MFVAETIVVRNDEKILFFKNEDENLQLPTLYKESRITKQDLCKFLEAETGIFVLEHEFHTLDVPDPHPCVQRFIIQNVAAFPIFHRPAIWGDISNLSETVQNRIKGFSSEKNYAV